MIRFMRGEPLVSKLAVLARFAVLPGAMIAALIYSPPDYSSKKRQQPSSSLSKEILDPPMLSRD